MTKKMTDMNATERRAVARHHRTEAAIASVEMDKVVGWSPAYVKAASNHLFHSTQAALWDVAAANAEASGNVRRA